MKKRYSLWLIVAAVVTGIFLAFSCGTPKLLEKTALEIKVSEAAGPKMLLPNGNNTFSSYIVTIMHQSTGYTDSQTVTAPPPPAGIRFPDIPVGIYSVVVSGYNSDTELIGTGTATAIIEPFETTSTTVSVAWAPGNGTVNVHLEIAPTGIINDPELEAQWYDGTTWTDISFTQTGEAWDYTATPSQGFHAIKFQLYSNMTPTMRPLIAGALEAVFILNNRTSTGTYTLDANAIAPVPYGEALIIVWEAPQPIIIGFVGAPDAVDIGESFTLTTTANSSLDTYQWYRDGVIMAGQAASTLTTSESGAGFHSYSVLGRKGSILASATKGVQIRHTAGEAVWIYPAAPVTLSNAEGTAWVLNVRVLDELGNPMADGTQLHWGYEGTSPSVLGALNMTGAGIIAGGNGEATKNCQIMVDVTAGSIFIPQFSTKPAGAGFASTGSTITFGF